jgi:hypothetical protein
VEAAWASGGEVHMHLCGTAPVVVIDSRNQNQALTSVGETTTSTPHVTLLLLRVSDVGILINTVGEELTVRSDL